MTPYLKALRIKHWVKNLFLFSAPFFGGRLFEEQTLNLALPVFLSFSFGASSVYVFNDIQDIERDRIHPMKREKPIIKGEISKVSAYIFAFSLMLVSLLISYKISINYFYFVGLYIIIHVFYSVYLKKIPIVDIFCIASGFVIRVFAGGEAFNTEVSKWLFLTMFMISLGLATGKRLSEVKELKEDANIHRTSLKHYSENFLKDTLLVSASASLICYGLYTIEQSVNLVYTLPVVTFGLLRYLMIADKGFGDPTDALTRDGYLFITVILWLFLVWALRY